MHANYFSLKEGEGSTPLPPAPTIMETVCSFGASSVHWAEGTGMALSVGKGETVPSVATLCFGGYRAT